jgi:ComF family protein
MTMKILDLLFPPLCIACREQVSESGFCAACWSALVFLDGPGCACCGTPFAVALEGETLCAACLARPPAFTRARAILAYDQKSRGPILALKHADRLDLVPGFARWLGRAGAAVRQDADLIVPVPLHRWRLWKRRYNQAAILSERLSRMSGVPWDPLALERKRPTPSQGEMKSAKARRRNVLGAFRVPKEKASQLRGKNILLVDDVFTTGATLDACARALKRAGSGRVDVLTLARVVKAGSGDI